MYRVIKAANQLEMNDKQVLDLIGREQYDQLYKAACMKIDDEIFNAYGDVEIDKWTNGGCTARDLGNGTFKITSKIYAEFISDRGRQINTYGELESTFDSSRPRNRWNPTVTFFTDELDYE